ncbi:MAG: DUF5110 domain-containing protein [Armatimonadetes bacterium]|nr:DUF5110 domain-containing protein [Armatimonadota bacterium]
METPEWINQAPGIWSTVVGKPEDLTPLKVAGATPRLAALREMGEGEFPLDPRTITTESVSSRTVIRIPLDSEEAIFGLGLQFLKVNHRGRTRYLRVNSDPRQDTGETHAPVPFYVSSRGYGVLVDTARIVTIYCGSCVRRDTPNPPALKDRGRDPDWEPTPTSDAVEIVVPGEGVEVFVFAGPTPLEVVRRYNLFCGGGVIPPRWGLGFWHRVSLQYNHEQVHAESMEYRNRDFPCDVIGLEPGWHSKSYPCSYEWAEDRFPDPPRFAEKMAAEGFHINLWEHAYVSPEAKIHAELEPLSGSHTVWGGLVPDYTLPEAREILKAQHEGTHLAAGVSGYKIDECDGSELTGCSWMFPAHATFPSGHDGEQMRQVYGLLLQKMTTEIFRKHDRRTWGLVRASNAGACSFPYVLYSDLYDHREFVRALCNSSFSGLLWTPEVRSAATAEEWVRRMQVVCFSPLAMLNAWSTSTMPWSFPDVEPIVRKYLKLRMRLMPYFYSAFARYYFEGVPPFRAMALEVPACDLDDQYMAGDSMLVAPMFAGETSREVCLPEGVWFDFETGKRFEGGGTIRVFPGLETMPVFVREGGLIPMMPPLPHAPRKGERVPLEVRHYGNAPGRLDLFDDDGETFAYQRGDYRWRTLEVTVDSGGTRTGTMSEVEEDRESSYGEIAWMFT